MVRTLDQEELQGTAERAPASRDAEELAVGIAAFIEQRLMGEGRRRSLARYACAIERVHHPELREILAPHENAGRHVVRGFLAEHGVEDAEGRAVTLLTCIDGLVFDRLVGGGTVIGPGGPQPRGGGAAVTHIPSWEDRRPDGRLGEVREECTRVPGASPRTRST
ncbi:hypothetical protein [Streptomyces sp. BH055]|uniref:hypothetical protein n=1 Tax=Streptomyces sp. BH055 TaxID=3401173 RepID=UPI003BB56349